MAKFAQMERPWKRKIQKQLSDILAAHKLIIENPGTIVGLCGPDPVAARRGYPFEIVSRFLFCESDYATYRAAVGKVPGMSLFTTILLNRDIFEELRICLTESHLISGIDFDFCETLHANLCQKIVNSVRSLLDTTDRPCIWVRIAGSMRGIGKQQTYANIAAIRDQCLVNIPWHLEDEVQASYTDQGAMGIWQGIFVRDKIAPEKEKTMKLTVTTKTTIKSGKTLSQLSEKDKLMVQVLSRNLGPGLELHDIQKKFNLADGTMAALRAHRTMRGDK